jgi:hypothetical protein
VEGRRRRRGVPASRAIHRVHTQEVVAARSSGVERRESRSSHSRREIEVGWQYGPKRTRRCSWGSAIMTGLVAAITELMMCAPEGGSGLTFCTGIGPHETGLGGQQDQVGTATVQTGLVATYLQQSEIDGEGEGRISDLPWVGLGCGRRRNGSEPKCGRECRTQRRSIKERREGQVLRSGEPIEIDEANGFWLGGRSSRKEESGITGCNHHQSSTRFPTWLPYWLLD